MNLISYPKYIFLIAVLLPIVANASSDQKCKRYKSSDDEYEEIRGPNYIFYDRETTCETLDAFLYKLEEGLKNDDSAQVAELISYPCTWRTADKKIIAIKNKAQFKKLYKKIFSNKIKKAAIEAEVSEVGYRGFMIDSGVIWFYPSVGIMCINQPLK